MLAITIRTRLTRSYQDSVAVENALYTEPAVFEAAAVGVPDIRLGELVAAVVTLKPAFRGKLGEKELIVTARKRFVPPPHSYSYSLSSKLETEVVPALFCWQPPEICGPCDGGGAG